MPLLKLSQTLHDIVFEPLSILSDFENKSQNHFQNLNVSGKNWVRDQFCHLQTAKKLQLIDGATCRKLLFKLPYMNLRDFSIMTEKEYAFLGAKVACRLTGALLHYLYYLFEKAFSGNDTSQNETHAENACIVLYSSIYIAPLNSRVPTEALLVRLAPRKETSFIK